MLRPDGVLPILAEAGSDPEQLGIARMESLLGCGVAPDLY